MSDQPKNPAFPQITYRNYVVKEGDSLDSIAQTQLGNSRYGDALYKLNARVIGSDKNKLRPGQLLRIPVPPKTSRLRPEVVQKPEAKKPKSYDFDHVNVWGHRWVNLMRAIKTTLEIADKSAVYLNAPMDQSSRSIVGDSDQSEMQAPEESIDDVDINEEEYIDDDEYVDDSVEEEGREYSEVETVGNARSSHAMSAAEQNDFEQVEKLQNQIIRNSLTNLARFVDIDMGKYINVLTTPRWQPTEERKRPPSALLRSVAKNASRDLEIYSKAIQQRQRRPLTATTGEVTLQARTLFLADKLAASALAPLQPFLDSSNPVNIISYLSGNIHVRQIPYDKQVILVSLPYASVSFWHDQKAYDELADFDQDILSAYKNRIPFDYMAIPHEIGHFLYHFAEMPNTTINDFFGPKYILPSKYTGWLEEIFADTVGCFIAGPLAVLGMQSLLSGTYEEELLYDNGFHPIPAIRPFIMSQILRRLSKHYGFPDNIEFKHAPDKLDASWWNHLQMVGAVPADASLDSHKFKFTLHANHDDNLPAHHHNNRHAKYHAEKRPQDEYIIRKEGEKVKTTVAKLQKEVNGVVDAFIHLLLFKADMTKFKMWSGDLTAEQELKDYEADLEKLLNIDLTALPELQVVRDTISGEERKELYKKANQFETEKELLRSLRAWGESGPNGWGGHP